MGFYKGFLVLGTSGDFSTPLALLKQLLGNMSILIVCFF